MAETQRRRRSSAETKARILEAAQASFASKGYAHSVLSEIAESAEVTSPLVVRYFGTKEALFEEAFAQSIDAVPFMDSTQGNFGRNAMALLIDGHPPTVRSTAMLAHSIGDPAIREIAIRLMRERVIAPVAEWLGGDTHAYARAELTVMLGVGYTTLRILAPAGEVDQAGEAFIADWMSKALQMVVELPADETPAADQS